MLKSSSVISSLVKATATSSSVKAIAASSSVKASVELSLVEATVESSLVKSSMVCTGIRGVITGVSFQWPSLSLWCLIVLFPGLGIIAK